LAVEIHMGELEDELRLIASQSHHRVRNITKEGQVKVKPQLLIDILGVYILQSGS